MASVSSSELSAEAIAAEKAKLAATRHRVKELSSQVAQLQAELDQARAEEASLASGLQWHELMAAADADASVYAVMERLTETFAAFRESLVEPENYLTSQQEEAKSDEEVVPFCDTDDYADFSAVEAAVEEVLATAKQSLETHAADPLVRPGHRSSLTESFAQRTKTVRGGYGADASAGAAGPSYGSEPLEARTKAAAERRRALLQLLVLTVLIGKVDEHCSFAAIADPSSAPSTDAEELRDGVASVWQWLFYEQPTVLSREEREEWMQVATSYLGEAYTAAP